MLNQVVIVGRLVRDVEVKKLEGDKSVAKISLAIPRSFKNAEKPFFSVVFPPTSYYSVTISTMISSLKTSMLY